MLLNGMIAALIARTVGARSLYFSVGGPAEFAGGGTASENRMFGALSKPHKGIEKCLSRTIENFDIIVTMGRRALEFLKRRNVKSIFMVNPGGIDSNEFSPTGGQKCYDVIYVGRLSPIKRLDILIGAVKYAQKVLPEIKVLIVGSGVLQEALEKQSSRLSLDRNITFCGHKADVNNWLGKAKLLVLTSDSEGLSLSMMEAMMSGLPVIVPKVGDLDDLVENGVNGYLVDSRAPEAFGECIVALLRDKKLYDSMSNQARQTALRFELKNSVSRWDEILRSLKHIRQNSN